MAAYEGDGSFATSTSTALEQVVIKDGATVTLVSSQNPSTFGESVTFIALVAAHGASGTPTGSVTFKDGTTVLGSSVLDASGNASWTTAALGGGTRSVVAEYGGDDIHASASGSVAQVVNPAATTTTLTASANPSALGQAVTFTAKVGGGTEPRTGDVTFADGENVLGTIPLDGGGQASFTTTTLTLGTHPITAKYDGDTNYAPSSSSALSQVVTETVEGDAGVDGGDAEVDGGDAGEDGDAATVVDADDAHPAHPDGGEPAPESASEGSGGGCRLGAASHRGGAGVLALLGATGLAACRRRRRR